MQHHVMARPNAISASSRTDPLAVFWRRLPPLDAGLVPAWRQWADGPHGRRHRRRWAEWAPMSARWSAHDLAHPRSGPATNELQHVLVVDAQQSRVVAALTLLVQLRPGLVRLARSAAGWDWYHGFDAAEETQATFFEVLYNLDLERRGRAVAANLVLDTRQRLWRHCPAGRRRSHGPPAGPPLPGLGWGESPGREPARWDSTGRDSTADPVVAVVDLQRHLAALPGSPASRQLSTDIAHRAWFQDQPSRLIAAELGLRRHTVDSRLYRIRESMRESMRM
jgi:DNA-directed RNA polymerase specialized sigma24 family protein